MSTIGGKERGKKGKTNRALLRSIWLRDFEKRREEKGGGSREAPLAVTPTAVHQREKEQRPGVGLAFIPPQFALG